MSVSQNLNLKIIIIIKHLSEMGFDKDKCFHISLL